LEFSFLPSILKKQRGEYYLEAQNFSSIHALILGLVQGLTEYLPVSSSAHLILTPRFLGVQDPGLAFDVFLHLGTLLATLIYFRADWSMVLRTFPWRIFNPAHSRATWVKWREALPSGESPLWLLIAAGTLPVLLVGALAHHWIETVLRGNAVLAVALVAGGLVLFGVDRFAPSSRKIDSLKLRDAFWVGLIQCFALIPGVSRSGSTMIAGRMVGLERGAAARFSFLLSAPVTLAALVFELRKFGSLLESVSGVWPLLLGAGAAYISGWLAIDGLLRLLQRFGFLAFAIYRIVLAVLIVSVLGV
jgi:undecaprenyl-diphosphatase